MISDLPSVFLRRKHAIEKATVRQRLSFVRKLELQHTLNFRLTTVNNAWSTVNAPR
jgi:hypothetical protein